ncbi:hypothetical protein MKW94_008568 [Papaver nudicaule]|uniref:Myb-like domain-containing protein n=1 Tax=Papaver nudicaule TaxID=74823 RepID=A0AA41SKF2_PAPNU|nr:hypothetical protein [Papaver nudicaule]
MAMDVISTQDSAMLLEFLLLQPNIGGNILKPLLTEFLPIHKNNPRIIQTILLKNLTLDSISEKTLDVLEKLEDFYHSNGIKVLDSMKEAYCAVAVHCTVNCLRQQRAGSTSTEGLRDYFEAVVRIWRGRVYDMERFGNVGLVSSKLREMKGVIEEVIWNENVRCSVLAQDTLGDAVRLVGVFVRDALKEFGESRLEIAFKDAAAGVGSRNFVQGERRGCNGGDMAVGVENSDCGLALPQERVLEARDTNGNDLGLDSVAEIRDGVNAECQLPSSQLERAKEAHDRNSNGLSVSSVTEIHREANNKCKMPVAEVRRLQKVLTASTSDSQPVVEVSHLRAESAECQLRSPQIERAQEAHQTNGNDLAASSVSEISRAANVRLRLPTPEVEIVRETHGTSSSNQDPHPTAAKDKYDISSPVIKRLREALRSSTLDLREVVKDPLPDALKMAATVSASMAREGTGMQNTVPAAEGVEASGNADEATNQCADTRPSLMSRNDTARTYEWSEESDSDKGSPSRPRLPTPRTINVSPLVIQDVKPKRRKKFWSVLEEETLRKAVNEIGRGNWTRILDENRDIFEERTALGTQAILALKRIMQRADTSKLQVSMIKYL